MHIDDDEAEVDLEDESLQNGINGISNLGNTCYINSTLNCLFKIQPLCDYFLNGLHHAEMNLANKLGSQGKVSHAFGDLLKYPLLTKDDG